MQHNKTLIAFAVIAFSLLAGSAFAGRTGYIVERAQAAKPAEQARHIDVAGGSQQTAAVRELPRTRLTPALPRKD